MTGCSGLGGGTKVSGAVVGHESVVHQHASAVSVQVILHVIPLSLHVGTHLVKGRCRNKMAFAIYLPGDGRVLRTDFIITGSSGSGSSVLGNIGALFTIDNHLCVLDSNETK